MEHCRENRGKQGFTDIHCHCLPGLDDGPADMAASLLLCEALVRDGIRTVVATPHQLGRYDGRYHAQSIREAVERLNRALGKAGISLTALPGADVRLDERIPDLLKSDQILTIADKGRHVLLELPHEVFIDPQELLAQLDAEEVRVVITHPERHRFLAANPQYVRRWAEFRPCLQITAASFTGDFGPLSRKAAFAFCRESFPLLVATDAHDVSHRPPRLKAAYELLRQRLGRDAANAACITNPARLLSGEDLLVSHGTVLRGAKE